MSVSTNPIAAGWLNENSLRSYPFHEGCGLRPSDSTGAVITGGWSLPAYLILDMTVSACGSLETFSPTMYLKRLSAVGGMIALVFADADGQEVVTVSATSSSHEYGQSYQLSGTGSFSDARGTICIGDLDRFFSENSEGLYEFSLDETLVEPTCIRPSASGVRSLSAVDFDGYMSKRLGGDLSLVAGRNIRMDYDADSNAIVISADSNSGYSDECDCDEEGGMFVSSINGVSVRDVIIEGDDCLDVTTSNGVITITDKCAKPCCGCAETAFINQTINDLQTSVNTLAGNVTTLGARLEDFITNYLLARKTL
jgi:hypothetical protein